NVEEGLTSYGMVAVELLGSGGELLNVADGKTVQLTMPVASGQTSSAPAEIPLWFFDETNGVWKEEGKATLQGNEYVGDVSHFTFWNCDINWDLIYLDGSVLLEGVSLEGAYVCLNFDSGQGWGNTACDVTNSGGVFSGQVPTNTTFTLNIYPAGYTNCGDAIYTTEVGPFTADMTLDPINIDPSAVIDNSMNVTGTLIDCDNNPVTNGYAKIKLGWAEYYAYTSDGTIDYAFTHCGTAAEVEITVVDLDDFTQSDPTTYPSAPSIDMGEVQACITLAEFITYELDGMTYTLTEYISINDSLGQGSGEQFITGQSNNQDYISLQTLGNAVGTFGGGFLYVSGTPTNPNGGNGSDISVTFTQYSEVVGETCEGTFSGEVTTGSGTSPITGSFKAIREF
ncbi:MAG: hypothetical protein AB8F94_16875, partial [Saprospiraceae bacterium]